MFSINARNIWFGATFIFFIFVKSNGQIDENDNHASNTNNCRSNNDTLFCTKLFKDAIDEVERAMKSRSIPGMILSVVYPDKDNQQRVWTKAFGYKTLEDPKMKTGPDTKFAIGSVTKGFTTTLMCILLEEHKNRYPLGLKTKVASILGESSLPTSIRKAYANLEDLLAHRLALLNYAPILLFGIDPDIPLHDFCRRMRLVETGGIFRNSYNYSNMMYVLAGCIVEIIGNDSYHNLLKKKIFEPLSMKDSILTEEAHRNGFEGVSNMYYRNDSDQRLIRIGHDLLRSVDKIPSAGGIITTGSDMAKWMAFQIRRGKDQRGHQRLKEDFWTQIHTTHMLQQHSIIDIPHTRPYHIFGYGLGWEVASYRNVRMSTHGGRLAGFDSKVTIIPTKNFSVFTSANGPAYDSYFFQEELHFVIYDLFFNRTFTGQSLLDANAHNYNIHLQHNHTYISVVVSNYLGMYGHHLFGNLTVSEDVSRDVIHLPEGSTHTSTHVFFHYGINGVTKLSFLTERLCKVAYLGNIELHSWVRSSSVYQFSMLFDEPDDNGRYRSVSLVSMVNVTFKRGLLWDSFGEETTKLIDHSLSYSLFPSFFLPFLYTLLTLFL